MRGKTYVFSILLIIIALAKDNELHSIRVFLLERRVESAVRICVMQLSTQYFGANSMYPGMHFDDDDDDDDEDEDFVDGTSLLRPVYTTGNRLCRVDAALKAYTHAVFCYGQTFVHFYTKRAALKKFRSQQLLKLPTAANSCK